MNDVDSDGTIDSSSVAAATAAVVAAEAAEQDLIRWIVDKASGIIINPADERIDALKAAVDTAKGTAQTLVNALPDSESAKDAQDLRLDAFTALTYLR